MRTLLRQVRVVSPGVDLPEADVLCEDGRILAVGSPADSGADEVVEGEGRLLMPGFVDIHTHGARGADICDGSAEAVRTVAEAKLHEGVTTFLPTTMTLPPEALVAAAEAVAEYQQRPTHARAAGLHVEGPFLNPEYIGAQNPEFARLPDASEIAALHEIFPVRIVSVAAELPGGVEFVREMAGRGIITSLAHTAATYADYRRARSAGLRHLTHFCNQMRPLHHREIGVVGAGLADGDVMIELICDEVHVCREMLSLIFQVKDPGQLMLVTDSMAASGMRDGDYRLGGQKVTVSRGVARLSSGVLAGSTLAYNAGLRNVQRLTGWPLSRLVAATSWNQARSLGLAGLGKVEPGFTADLVLLDEDLEVRAVICRGRRCFGR